MGIRELRGGNSSRYTNAFSFLFTDRSDLILSSSSPNEVHRWMRSVKKCGIPILVSIAGVNTLTRSISEANVVGMCDCTRGRGPGIGVGVYTPISLSQLFNQGIIDSRRAEGACNSACACRDGEMLVVTKNRTNPPKPGSLVTTNILPSLQT